MRLLIDIGHPAHVHYFKNLARDLQLKGHEIFFTVKNLVSARGLLDILGFKYIVLPEKSDSLFGKAFNQIRYDWILYRICKKHKIEMAMGVSITVSHLSLFSKVISLVFDDDDDHVQPLFVRWSHPFATELLSPDVLKGKQKRRNAVYYPGYHELAYLHPSRFTPDAGVLSEIGVSKEERFFLVRFNAFKAHHDQEVNGLSPDQKRELVKFLSKRGRVFITGERELEPEFEKYRIKISPEKIHSLIYYSSMLVGDSQTMTSEAAVLGIPSLRFNSLVGELSYLEEEEHRYGLTFGFKPDQFESLLTKIEEILEKTTFKEEWFVKRDRMLMDKIDVTAFWLWFIEEYPNSKIEYLRNPAIVNQFK